MRTVGKRYAGILGLGFGAWMMGACDVGTIGPLTSGGNLPNPAGSSVPPGSVPPIASDPPSKCPATNENPCMRYLIPLAPDPNANLALRAQYIKAFGSACYMSEATMSEASTFNCFYQSINKACEDAVLIGEVSGNAPYDKGYKCQPVGNGDYTLQIGSDVSNKLFVYYQPAPRQTPFIPVDGMPTEVSGPYRNLVEVTSIEPGKDFYDKSGMFNDKGEGLRQRDWILEVNRKSNGGKIRSDLAGFTWPCEDGDGGVTTCEELDFLADPDDGVPPFHPGEIARVHHVVPMKDPRCCPWGTNTYKNAAVISHELNEYFKNNDPPEEEVKRLNNAPAYTP